MTDYAAPETLTVRTRTKSVHVPLPTAANAPLVSGRIVKGFAELADGVAVVAMGWSSLLLVGSGMDMPERHFGLLSVVFGAFFILNLMIWSNAYRFDTLRRLSKATMPMLLSWFVTAAVLAAILQFAGMTTPLDRKWLLEWMSGTLVVMLAIRVVLQYLSAQWDAAGRLTRQVAVVGAGPIGERLLRHLKAVGGTDVRIVGVYEDRHQRLPDRCAGFPVRGSVDDLILDVRRRRIDSVIVTLPLSAEARVSHIVEKLHQTPTSVTLCPDWFDSQAGTLPMGQLADVSLLRAAEPPLREWRGIAKEIEDRILSAFILLLISPLLLAIVIAIKLDSSGPVFFRQKRYGFNNELIEVLKFRSMYHHARDANAEQLTRRNDPRVTKVGAFLRRTSLDELPQFINVLRGEMSIVGPRPHALAAKAGGILYPDAVEFYHARHRMKPGITGWAQVNGWRGETETVEQIVKRVEHDLYYVEHWSVLFDIKIILRTVLGGFMGRHAY